MIPLHLMTPSFSIVYSVSEYPDVFRDFFLLYTRTIITSRSSYLSASNAKEVPSCNTPKLLVSEILFPASRVLFIILLQVLLLPIPSQSSYLKRVASRAIPEGRSLFWLRTPSRQRCTDKLSTYFRNWMSCCELTATCSLFRRHPEQNNLMRLQNSYVLSTSLLLLLHLMTWKCSCHAQCARPVQTIT